ncbi:Protein HupE [Burkholderiales bacterium 8X]|nr:Protein HupE [Burkholderiales bacterium 8X]
MTDLADAAVPPAHLSMARRLARQAARSVVPALLLALLPLGAVAHTGADAGLHHGWMAGFVHPFAGMDHLAAMLAVGLWSALVAGSSKRSLWVAPAGFAAMLLVGALAGMGGMQVPAVEPVIAASLLVLGLLVAVRKRLPLFGALALVSAFAVFHGIAHGRELVGESGGLAILAGMLAATLLLHAIGIAIGLSMRNHSRWMPRAAGGAIALLGLALLGGVA